METFTDEIIRDLFASSLETATHDGSAWSDTGSGPGSKAADHISFLTISDPLRLRPIRQG